MIQLHYSTRFYEIGVADCLIKNTNKSQFILTLKNLNRKELVEYKLMAWWFLLQQHILL